MKCQLCCGKCSVCLIPSANPTLTEEQKSKIQALIYKMRIESEAAREARKELDAKEDKYYDEAYYEGLPKEDNEVSDVFCENFSALKSMPEPKKFWFVYFQNKNVSKHFKSLEEAIVEAELFSNKKTGEIYYVAEVVAASFIPKLKSITRKL